MADLYQRDTHDVGIETDASWEGVANGPILLPVVSNRAAKLLCWLGAMICDRVQHATRRHDEVLLGKSGLVDSALIATRLAALRCSDPDVAEGAALRQSNFANITNARLFCFIICSMTRSLLCVGDAGCALLAGSGVARCQL